MSQLQAVPPNHLGDIQQRTGPPPQIPKEWQSIGQLITDNEDFKRFIDKKSGARSISMHFPHFGKFNRATGTTTGFTSIDKQPGVVLLGAQPPMVGDVIPEVPTNHTTIRYIRENSFTNAATALAEEGALPEASWDLNEADAPVKKIAVLGRVTEEMLADVDGAQVYLNGRLAFMVQAKEDGFLLNGTGLNNQITGILNTSGIQTQAQGTDVATDAIHKAMTKIRTVGFMEPTAIIMHPLDWENFKLMKDKNAQYLSGGPCTGAYGQPIAPDKFLWGKPVVLTTFIAQTTCLVGAFDQACGIHRKLGLTIEMSNSDASDFANGRVAIRAVTRLALRVSRPLGFATCTGLN